MTTQVAQVEEFMDSMYLVCPSMGWWRGLFQIPKDEVQVQLQGVALDQKRLTGNSLRLMHENGPSNNAGKAWTKVFASLESERSSLFTDHYVQFAVRGVYCIPKNAYPGLMHRIYGKLIQDADGAYTPCYNADLAENEPQSLAYRFNEAANEFAANYDEIVKEIQAGLTPREWELVKPHMPAKRTIRGKFYFTITLLGLSNMTTTEAMEVSEYGRQATEMATQAARQRVQQAIEAMVAEPRQQLYDAMKHVVELAEREGRVTNRSYGAIREAIAKIRTYECVSSASVLEQVGRLEQHLRITPATSLASDEDVRAQFSQLVESIGSELTDAMKQSQDVDMFGNNRRRIVTE